MPTIAESPVSMELRVQKEIHMAEGSDVFLCEIAGVSMKEELMNQAVPFIDRYLSVMPVLAGGEFRYVTADGRDLGLWGEPMQELAEK